MRTIKKHWGNVVAAMAICLGLSVICYILVSDAQNDGVVVASTSSIPTTAPMKSVAAKPAPVQPPRVNSSVVPSDYTTLHGDTITYVATGSPATISYGVDAKETGTVPLRKTEIIRGSYFSLIAQMDNGGYKTKIVVKVNGVTIAKTSATVDHQIASIAITKEYGTGKWIAIPSTS